MIRAAIVLTVIILSSPAFAARFDKQRATDDVRWRLSQDERRPLAVDALTSMFTFAARNLREADRGADADTLLNEWNGHYKGVVAGITPEDVGDHLPYLDWLARWYQALEDQFGIDYMEWSHLRDIWVLNFTLPVVFNPTSSEQWCRDQMTAHPSDSCKREYARHFVGTYYDQPGDPYNTPRKHHGFSGVVAYWTAFAACEAVTYGTGWVLLCAPAATVIELTTEIFIAPDISDMIWDRHN